MVSISEDDIESTVVTEGTFVGLGAGSDCARATIFHNGVVLLGVQISVEYSGSVEKSVTDVINYVDMTIAGIPLPKVELVGILEQGENIFDIPFPIRKLPLEYPLIFEHNDTVIVIQWGKDTNGIDSVKVIATHARLKGDLESKLIEQLKARSSDVDKKQNR